MTRFRDMTCNGDHRALQQWPADSGAILSLTRHRSHLRRALCGVSGLAETLARDSAGDPRRILLPVCPMFRSRAAFLLGRPLSHSILTIRRSCSISAVDALPARYTLEWPPDVEVRCQRARIRLRLSRAAHKGWRPAIIGVDEPACVLFTSGSTGRPKSIVNSQRNLLQRVAQSINAAHINPADSLLTLASPCTIVGIRDVMTALLAGASIHLLDPRGVSAREILDVIRKEAITILFAFRHFCFLSSGSRERAGASLRWSASAGTRRCGATSKRCARGSHRRPPPTDLRRQRSADAAVVRRRRVQARRRAHSHRLSAARHRPRVGR